MTRASASMNTVKKKADGVIEWTKLSEVTSLTFTVRALQATS